METFAILLRGVMPRGRNRVPMAELRAALSRAGLQDVQTYIQSGNVVARSRRDPAGIQALVHEAIAREIGADIAVIARTHRQLRDVLEGNPFPRADAAPTYFSLLASEPAAARVDQLRRVDVSPDFVEVAGDMIYTRYATKLSDSKFTNNFFERKLKVVATTRNFNTLSRLVELSA